MRGCMGGPRIKGLTCSLQFLVFVFMYVYVVVHVLVLVLVLVYVAVYVSVLVGVMAIYLSPTVRPSPRYIQPLSLLPSTDNSHTEHALQASTQRHVQQAVCPHLCTVPPTVPDHCLVCKNTTPKIESTQPPLAWPVRPMPSTAPCW